MHAVVIDDGELRWEERPDPEPGDTELLVDVRAAGLNGADMSQRAGRYPAPPGSPADIPGLEIAGEVVAVGPAVRRFSPGDRVMGLLGGGGQATRAVIDELHAMPVPASLSWPEAGGFCEVFATAFDAIFSNCGLRMGERMLVTGAAGGVGVAAVQLAAAAGARVVASVRDPARRDEVAALGADLVVAPDEASDQGPFDVALELVGAASLPGVLGALATGARVWVVGVGSGAQIELNLFHLMRSRSRLGGSTIRARDRREKANVIAAVEAQVLPLLSNGKVRVPVCEAFAMGDAAAAYERFVAGGKLGKVVLTA